MERVTLGFFVFDGEYCDASSELQMIRSVWRGSLSRLAIPEAASVLWVQLQRNEDGAVGGWESETDWTVDLTSLMQSGCIMGDSLFSEVSRLEAKQADALDDFIHYYSADLE